MPKRQFEPTAEDVAGLKGIAAAVKRLREEAAISKAEVGRRGGLSPSSVGDIETGEVEPTWGTLRRLAKGLGVPLPDFLKLCDRLTPKPQSADERDRLMLRKADQERRRDAHKEP